ncbi:MAG: FAD-binding protein, partial [Planctomycetaceae bacterium]|nr:FAD-binding protein [Planctomycetaceae bacterium]
RAGACLGHGLVLDFTKFMRRVVQAADDSVTVQPGATLERVNSQLLHAQGRIIGPDPGYLPATTIGSMLAVDGAGARWLSRGRPHQAVRKLQVVLANGDIVTLERGGWPVANHEMAFAGQLSRELAGYLSLTSVSKAVAKQSAASQSGLPGRFGYRVCDVSRPEGHVDFMPLLLGSEGTLGIITQAELDTIPAPPSSGIVLFLFDLIDNAMQAVPIIRAHHPASCELIDRRRITLLRDWDARFKASLPHDAEAILVVEMEGDHPLIVGDRLHDLVNELRHDRRLCYTTRVAVQPDDLALFRSMVAKSQFALYRMQHYLSGISRFEDTVVPIDRLSAFIVTVQNLFKRHELAPSFFGHVGHGQVSVQPVLHLSTAVALAQLRRVAPEYYDEVLKLGGTISSEQAFGWARTPFLPVYHEAYYPVYEQVKKLFDPKGLLNPGKVVPRQDTPPLEYRSPIVSKRHLANVALYDRANEPVMQANESPADEPADESNGEPLQRQLEVQLKWDPLPIRETTMRCNGCGLCRSRATDTRMCPVFRRDMSEESTPRAKANLMRGILDGQSDLGLLTLGQSKTVADYCIHCHLCRLDCPAEVDMPKIAFQIKCAYAAAHGLSLSDRFFSYLDRTLKFLVPLSYPINWSITNRFTRWLYEKVFGLSQARKLPKLAKISYLSRAIWYKRLSKPSRRRDRKVALFVDVYANHFETRIADAAVKVLEHNGIDVYVPGRQQASGAFAIACGDRDRAEKLSRKNISLLADIIRQGYHVVTLEPTSALCLTEEYGYMADDADAVLVAANTSDVMTYLYRLHQEGKFQTDFSPLPATMGYHAPCRSLILGRCNLADQTPAEQLLRLVPELNVKRLEHGCCGVAGSFGLTEKNFRMSLRIGLPLLSALRDPAIQLGASECCLCKMQMEQGGSKLALHPIVLLAHAYGFLPEIEPMISQQQSESSATE